MVVEKKRPQIFEPDSETFLMTDASDVGLRAVLSQRRTLEDPERPITYFNKMLDAAERREMLDVAKRMLDAAERNYDVTEKEALVTLKAVEHLEGLLLG